MRWYFWSAPSRIRQWPPACRIVMLGGQHAALIHEGLTSQPMLELLEKRRFNSFTAFATISVDLTKLWYKQNFKMGQTSTNSHWQLEALFSKTEVSCAYCDSIKLFAVHGRRVRWCEQNSRFEITYQPGKPSCRDAFAIVFPEWVMVMPCDV